jgi:hypothetical protein
VTAVKIVPVTVGLSLTKSAIFTTFGTDLRTHPVLVPRGRRGGIIFSQGKGFEVRWDERPFNTHIRIERHLVPGFRGSLLIDVAFKIHFDFTELT